jgi:hypothetical protein
VRGPAYTCKVCGQEFWHEATEMLRILPDHLVSTACRRARRRSWMRSLLASSVARARQLLFGRPFERTEFVIQVPMEPVTVAAPGPIDLLAPAYEEQLTATGGSYPLPPLRWRRAPFDRLCSVVDEQVGRAQRRGLKPERPVDYAELRRWSRCRVVYPDGPGGARRAQGQEELTVLMTRR